MTAKDTNTVDQKPTQTTSERVAHNGVKEGKVKKVSRSMSLKVASSVPKRVIIEAAAEKSPKKAGKVMRKDAGHTPKARRRPKRPFNERLIN